MQLQKLSAQNIAPLKCEREPKNQMLGTMEPPLMQLSVKLRGRKVQRTRKVKDQESKKNTLS